jgi:hypothetical protein
MPGILREREGIWNSGTQEEGIKVLKEHSPVAS